MSTTTMTPTIPTFDDLYQQYSRAIYERILYLVHDQQRAEDLTQETFLKVWRALPGLAHTNNLFAWLARIATNTVIDAERVRQRHERIAYFTSLDSEDAPDVADERADPEVWYLSCEPGVAAALMKRLKPVHRQALLAIVNEEPVADARARDRRYRARARAKRVYVEVLQEVL